MAPWEPAFAQTDYDSEDNGYIDITTLAQLNAIRYDLNGDGVVADGNAANYNAAFPNAATGMGCPSSGCIGYELKADLDFDTNNTGATYTETAGTVTGDSGDDYYNGGSGWQPIGDYANPYFAKFKGNGKTISNLFINRSSTEGMGLFGSLTAWLDVSGLSYVQCPGGSLVGERVNCQPALLRGPNVGPPIPGRIEGLGVIDAYVAGGRYTGILLGSNDGGIVATSYTTGTVTAPDLAGGLIGDNAGNIIASYSTADATVTGGPNPNIPPAAGSLVGSNADTINASYAIGKADPLMGLVGMNNSGTLINSYWDKESSGAQTEFENRFPPGSFFRSLFDYAEGDTTTSALQTPTSATGIYAGWDDLDVTGDGTADDDPWNFGTANQYPVLNYADLYPDLQTPPVAPDTDPGPPVIPDTEPTFTDALDPQNYRQGSEIAPLTLPVATDGNGTLTYSLADLPEGLHFDAETLILSGTPTEAAEKAIYTLTVTDGDGDEATMSFFMTILADVMPSFESEMAPSDQARYSYMRNQEIEAVTLPQASGGDGTLTYTLTPDLPEGLTFDAETRILSGMPTEAIDETTYTLIATDADGDEATLVFILEVEADLIPAFGDTTIAAQVHAKHREIEPLTLPQATGGDGTLTYALTPDLPEGLTFDTETLMLSGMPTETMDAMTYTLTATDGNGDEVYLRFTLEVPNLVPTFGDTTLTDQSYIVNQQVEPLTLPVATSGDGTLVYILLPFLPDGLKFDPETRVLSGTPIEEMDETTYTLSALDVDGDFASLTFALEVGIPSSDFDGDGAVNFADFLTFAGKFGTRRGEDGYDARFDLDGNGEIGFSDFLIFAASFGATS